MRTMQKVFMMLSVLCMAVPAFAQASGGDSSHASMVAIAAGISMAIASGLCGLGEGYAVGSSSLAIARNPGARPEFSCSSCSAWPLSSRWRCSLLPLFLSR